MSNDDNNITHIINRETVGLVQLESFDCKGQAGPGVTFEIACREVKRLTAEVNDLKGLLHGIGGILNSNLPLNRNALAKQLAEGLIRASGSHEVKFIKPTPEMEVEIQENLSTADSRLALKAEQCILRHDNPQNFINDHCVYCGEHLEIDVDEKGQPT